MIRALDGITADGLGDAVSPELLATLSPYQTEHINRFGDYVLDMSKPPAPLPFVCTTNFAERLDPATLRRFTFTLRFEPLSAQQAASAFERFFGVVPPRPLPQGLAPGDFATVRRKAKALASVAPELLSRWLDDEAAAKGCGRQPIGFAIA